MTLTIMNQLTHNLMISPALIKVCDETETCKIPLVILTLVGTSLRLCLTFTYRTLKGSDWQFACLLLCFNIYDWADNNYRINTDLFMWQLFWCLVVVHSLTLGFALVRFFCFPMELFLYSALQLQTKLQLPVNNLHYCTPCNKGPQ